MSDRKDFFKKLHPEQFSDSTITQVGQLNKDFFDYYLESLTSKGLEKNFEIFCRRISEAEICPNLLPQTGPTGGGDSKVDSETYPVAEFIASNWYHNIGDKAATERWAFAFSAKKDWRPKVFSDVEKIIEVNTQSNRGYTKIFFISNQYISDKKRAETEDNLRNKYQLDIRILDRTWLLEKVFSTQNNKNIAIECFTLSDCFKDEIKIGSRDYERQQELAEIEAKLKNDETKYTERISLLKRSVILARELEFPKDTIVGLLNRYSMEVNKFGNLLGNQTDIADAICTAAWTIYWWYPDSSYYYERYIEYEEIAINSDNVHFFSNLVILWLNLNTLSQENNSIQIDKHTTLLKEKYSKFISDSLSPNSALEAKVAYQFIRFFIGDKIDDIVNDMIEIINESEGRLDLDIYQMGRIIQETPMLTNAKRYDELFELLVSVLQKRSSEISAANLLARRGNNLKESKPYEALVYFSRCLMPFYTEEAKHKLIVVLIDMADIFQKVDLLWAARNYYYYAFCLCFNQYMKFGEASPALFITSHSLKYIELKLGQMIYSAEFDFLEKIADEIYPEKIDIPEQAEDNFDFIFGIQIFRTSFDVIKKLEQFPEYLEKRKLEFSKAAIEYELGYYNEEILEGVNGNVDAFDDFIGKWKNQPVLEQLRALPWYGFELPYVMSTSVLGCQIEVHINESVNKGEVEIGSTILATIESFLGTGVAHKLFSLMGKIIIEIYFNDAISSIAEIKIHDKQPNRLGVTFIRRNKNKFVEEQEGFSNFLLELVSHIITIMFPYKPALDKLKDMVMSDFAFFRSQTFSNSIFYGLETFGTDMFSFEYVVKSYEKMIIKRTEKASITDSSLKTNREDKIKQKKPHVQYGLPIEETEFANIGHGNIKTSSIINIPLWDKSKWRAVYFFTVEPPKNYPPLLSLVFSEELSKTIFEEWIAEVGRYDEKDKIEIKIIKGIDKNHPHWYRLIISSANDFSDNLDKSQLIMFPARVHTMNAESNINLARFESALIVNDYFYLCPSMMKSKTGSPQLYESLKIKKNTKSIKVINAWEIPEDDFITLNGILPDDNPIVPDGIMNVPILEAIKRKRQYNNSQ